MQEMIIFIRNGKKCNDDSIIMDYGLLLLANSHIISAYKHIAVGVQRTIRLGATSLNIYKNK